MKKDNSLILVYTIIILVIALLVFKDRPSAQSINFGNSGFGATPGTGDYTYSVQVEGNKPPPDNLDGAHPRTFEIMFQMEQPFINENTRLRFTLQPGSQEVLSEYMKYIFIYVGNSRYSCKYDDVLRYWASGSGFTDCCKAGGWAGKRAVGDSEKCYKFIPAHTDHFKVFLGGGLVVFDNENVVEDVVYETQPFGAWLNQYCDIRDDDVDILRSDCGSALSFWSASKTRINMELVFDGDVPTPPTTHKEHSFTPSDNTFSLNPGESKSTTITLEHLGEMIANEDYELKFDITGSVII